MKTSVKSTLKPKSVLTYVWILWLEDKTKHFKRSKERLFQLSLRKWVGDRSQCRSQSKANTRWCSQRKNWCVNVFTLGTAACRTTLWTGRGAVLSIDTTITNTSGRPGGQSEAKLSSTRTPSLSYAVTGKTLPEDTQRIASQAEAVSNYPLRCWALSLSLTRSDSLQRDVYVAQGDFIRSSRAVLEWRVARGQRVEQRTSWGWVEAVSLHMGQGWRGRQGSLEKSRWRGRALHRYEGRCSCRHSKAGSSGRHLVG